MRYLSVFIPQQPTKPIVVVDLNKPERVSVIDAIYYCDFHNGHAFISNYKNIFTAKFDRRADNGDPSSMTFQNALKVMSYWQS